MPRLDGLWWASRLWRRVVHLILQEEAVAHHCHLDDVVCIKHTAPVRWQHSGGYVVVFIIRGIIYTNVIISTKKGVLVVVHRGADNMHVRQASISKEDVLKPDESPIGDIHNLCGLVHVPEHAVCDASTAEPADYQWRRTAAPVGEDTVCIDRECQKDMRTVDNRSC